MSALARKSTLIKILTGAYLRTSGTILLDGEEYEVNNPREARLKGVATLFQELNVVDQLTVEENLTLGVEDVSFGFLKKSQKIRKMLEVLKSIEPSIEPQQKVAKLSVAKKQIVEIAKAVAMYVLGTVITSSPEPISHAASARCSASVPLLTPIAKRVPQNAANSCSNAARSGPIT